MDKAVEIINGILFVRTRHYDDVTAVIVRHQEKRKRYFIENKTAYWKLVQRKPYIDIACSHCENVRFKEYAYNCTFEQTLKHLKTVDKNILPLYCEHCGSRMLYLSEVVNNYTK